MKPTAFLVLGLISLVGCRKGEPPPTIWQNSVTSPDHEWTALAHTFQDGGFGSAYIGTVVELQRNNKTADRGKPVQVLDFECLGPAKRAYTLSEENKGGTIHLQMKWADPANLTVTYDGRATVNFQVVRLVGVNITLQVVPTDK